MKKVSLPPLTANLAAAILGIWKLKTAGRRETLLLMTSILNAEAQLALVSGRSAPSR